MKNTALTLIGSFATGDTAVAKNALAENYIQHNLAYPTGREAFVGAVEYLRAAPIKTTTNTLRAFADGDCVFLHTVYNFAGTGEQVAFDVFRFEQGKIAEHWDNLAALAPRNPAGHTQTDGPTAAVDHDKTVANKALCEQFVRDVLMGENPGKFSSYFDGDRYIQHNISMADGPGGLGAALAARAKTGAAMPYKKIHMVLGEGNFVLVVSEGAFDSAPIAFYDLWRVENNKLAEHWDVMETIAARETWANPNGKF